jgi:hypothetical protein
MDILAKLDRVVDHLHDREAYFQSAIVRDAMDEIREMRALIKRYLNEKELEHISKSLEKTE